jgi:arylsulfatase
MTIDGKKAATAKVPKTEFAIFSADETAGVGVDWETPVTDAYTRPFPPTAAIPRTASC